MNTTAVIVTYADRYNYVKQVIDRISTFGLYRIIIVNNNSVEECFIKLQALSSSNSLITIVNLEKNTGSAYAFNRGIETAIQDQDSEFLWLIDDDNLPEPDALEILKGEWQDILFEDKNRKLIFASLRSGKQNYMNAVENSDPLSIVGHNNIFRSFHIKKLFTLKNKNAVGNTKTYGEISAAPYGGMFFHRQLISEIGFADESYYLYCDDFDFCCRHSKNGGKIFLSLDSRIADIEESWNVNGRAIDYIACGADSFRIYYSIRNRVYLEKKYLITCWPVYIINMIIYSCLVTIRSLSRFRFKNIATYYTALFHGLSGKMGCNTKYSP